MHRLRIVHFGEGNHFVRGERDRFTLPRFADGEVFEITRLAHKCLPYFLYSVECDGEAT